MTKSTDPSLAEQPIHPNESIAFLIASSMFTARSKFRTACLLCVCGLLLFAMRNDLAWTAEPPSSTRGAISGAMDSPSWREPDRKPRSAMRYATHFEAREQVVYEPVVTTEKKARYGITWNPFKKPTTKYANVKSVRWVPRRVVTSVPVTAAIPIDDTTGQEQRLARRNALLMGDNASAADYGPAIDYDSLPPIQPPPSMLPQGTGRAWQLEANLPTSGWQVRR